MAKCVCPTDTSNSEYTKEDVHLVSASLFFRIISLLFSVSPWTSRKDPGVILDCPHPLLGQLISCWLYRLMRFQIHTSSPHWHCLSPGPLGLLPGLSYWLLPHPLAILPLNSLSTQYPKCSFWRNSLMMPLLFKLRSKIPSSQPPRVPPLPSVLSQSHWLVHFLAKLIFTVTYT